ncbi:hypothetical protein LCGC14_2968120, partial [marine sediment metagenome]
MRFTPAHSTLEDVRNDVYNYSQGCQDREVDLKDIEFCGLGRVLIKDFGVWPTHHAQQQICSRLRIPYNYLRRCPGEQQTDHLNYWMKREEEKRDTFFIRFHNRHIRAWFTKRYVPLDNTLILDKLIEHYGPGQRCSVKWDDNFMNLFIRERNGV